MAVIIATDTETDSGQKWGFGIVALAVYLGML